MYTTLILSGNAVNGIMTLGALQRLHDTDALKNIKTYIGTSSGAILSLLLIVGFDPLEIVAFLCTEKPMKHLAHAANISNLLILGKPILQFDLIKQSLEKLILEKVGTVPTMQTLRARFRKDLVVATYNLSDDTREYLSAQSHPHLSVLDAVCMSSSYPLMFDPYVHDGKMYVDGGVVDNFPIEFEAGGAKSLGIVTVNQKDEREIPVNSLEYIWHLFQVFIQTSADDKIRRSPNCDVVKLVVKRWCFDFKMSNKEILALFDSGYDALKNSHLL